MPTPAQLTPLQSALRNAARWSLYLSFGALMLTGAALYALLKDKFTVTINPWYNANFLDYREVRDLQQLVGLDTTHETGREMDAALWLQEQLGNSGIEAEIEDMGGGKANLVAKIEGQTDEFLVLHNHLDTDPIGDRERWNFDPWSAHIEVVWLYARGSFDMKSTVIAQLHAMQALQALIDSTGERPQRGLMLLSTSSEETGSHEGAQHIVTNRSAILDGAWALLSEGGVVEAIDIDVVKYLGISFGQKRFVDVWYSVPADRVPANRVPAEGVPAEQAQSPAETNPLNTLQALRQQIQSKGQPSQLHVTPPVRRFLATYGPTRALTRNRDLLAAPDRIVTEPGAFERLPAFFRGLFRNEVHALQPAYHAASDSYRMRVVIHLLEGADVDQAIEELLPPASSLDESLTVWIDPSLGSERSSPLDHPAYTTMVEDLAADLEYGVVGPYYLTYFANDMQFFRKLSIPSYGFQPFFSVAAESYSVGNYNERIALPTFIEGVERYRRVVGKLIEAPLPLEVDTTVPPGN